MTDQKESRESSANIVSKPCNIDQKLLQEQKEKMEKWIKENVSNKSKDVEKQNTSKVAPAARKGSGPAQHTISKIGRTYVKGNASILYNMALKRGNVGSDTSDSDSDKPPLKMTKPRHKRLDRIALHNSAKITRKIQSSTDPEIKDTKQEKNPIVHVGKYNRAVQRQNVLPKLGYSFNNTIEAKTSQKLSDILKVLDKNGGPKVRITAESIDEMFDGYASTDSESSEASTLCESDSEPESVIQKEDRKMVPANPTISNCEQNEVRSQNHKRERLPSICLESDGSTKVLFEGSEENVNHANSGSHPNTATKETMMDQPSGSGTRQNPDLVSGDMETGSNKGTTQDESCGPDPSKSSIIQNVNSGSNKNDERESGISDDGSESNSISKPENKIQMDNGSCEDHQSFHDREILKEKHGSGVDCKTSIQSPEGVFQNRTQDQDCTFAGHNNGVGTRTGACDSNLDHKSNPDFSQEGEMSNGLTRGSPATIKGEHAMTQDITYGVKNHPSGDCVARPQQSLGSSVCKRAIDCEHKSAFGCDESHKIKAYMNSKLQDYKASEPNSSAGETELKLNKHPHVEHDHCNNKIKAPTSKLSVYNDVIISWVDMDANVMQSLESKYSDDKSGSKLGNERIGNSNGGVLENDPTTHTLTEEQNACMAGVNGSTETHKYCMSDVKPDYFDSQSIRNQYLSYNQHDNDQQGDSHSINGDKMSDANACIEKYFPNTASLGPETHSSEPYVAAHKSTADICEYSHESDLICDEGLHHECNSCGNRAIVENPGVCQKGQEAIKAGNQAKINNKSEEDMEENIQHDKSMSGVENSNREIIKDTTIEYDGVGDDGGVSDDRFNEGELKGSCRNLECVDVVQDNGNSSQSDLCHNGAQSGPTQTRANDGRDNEGLGALAEVKVITNSNSGKLERDADHSGNGNSCMDVVIYGTLRPKMQREHAKCEENGTSIGDWETQQPSVTHAHDPNSDGGTVEFQHVMDPSANLKNNKHVEMRHESASDSDQLSCGSLKKGKLGLEGASNVSTVVTTKAKSTSDGTHSLHNTIGCKIDEPSGSALCANTAITCELLLMARPVDACNMPNYMEPTSGFGSGEGTDPSCPETNDTKCSPLDKPDVHLIPSDILKDKIDVQIDGSPASDEAVPGLRTFDGTRVTTGGVIEGQMACHQSGGNEALEVLVPATSLHDKCSTESTVQSQNCEGGSNVSISLIFCCRIVEAFWANFYLLGKILPFRTQNFVPISFGYTKSKSHPRIKSPRTMSFA